MPSLLITRPQVGSERLHKLWVTAASFHSVVFATVVLGTIRQFVSSLSELAAQASAQLFRVNNSVRTVFVHTIHNPNKS